MIYILKLFFQKCICYPYIWLMICLCIEFWVKYFFPSKLLLHYLLAFNTAIKKFNSILIPNLLSTTCFFLSRNFILSVQKLLNEVALSSFPDISPLIILDTYWALSVDKLKPYLWKIALMCFWCFVPWSSILYFLFLQFWLSRSWVSLQAWSIYSNKYYWIRTMCQILF